MLAIFFLVTVIGYFGTKFIRNPFTIYLEKLVEKAPLAKLIYTSVKDLISAFVGEKKRFNHPVMVKLDRNSEAWRVGFIHPLTKKPVQFCAPAPEWFDACGSRPSMR